MKKIKNVGTLNLLPWMTHEISSIFREENIQAVKNLQKRIKDRLKLLEQEGFSLEPGIRKLRSLQARGW